VRRLAKQYPMVAEINSDDVAELRVISRPLYWYNRLTRDRWLRLVRGMVFVTAELAKRPHFTGYNKPFKVISNGIDLSSYKPLPPPNNVRPRLVFMGSNAPWQGIDKVLWLAHRFPEWQFDLIGINPNEFLGNELPNVKAYGFLSSAAYESILAEADVAIGTLALHRNDMEEACTLKVREYLSCGIPTIIGYKDTDFPKTVPFVLQLPNTSTNVQDDVQKIEWFVNTWKGHRVPREAVLHLDVAMKEQERLQFFAQVVELTSHGVETLVKN
jgi:glycosyltransferase involved in cell wall biosynthesis